MVRAPAAVLLAYCVGGADGLYHSAHGMPQQSLESAFSSWGRKQQRAQALLEREVIRPTSTSTGSAASMYTLGMDFKSLIVSFFGSNELIRVDGMLAQVVVLTVSALDHLLDLVELPHAAELLHAIIRVGVHRGREEEAV